MKKYLWLILILFLLTGCDIEYNLKIDNDSYTEDINIITPDTDSWKSIVENASKIKQISYIDNSSNEKHYYDSNKNDNNNELNYTYKFNENNILYSSAITDCYKYVTMDTTKGYIDIKTNPSLSCWYRDGVSIIDSLKVNITTPLKVVSNNADKVSGNTYTWIIDESNFENKPIEIKMEKPKESNDTNINVLIIILILIGIIVLATVIYLIIKRKHEKTNSI